MTGRPDAPLRVPAGLLAVAAIFSVQFGNAIVGSMFDRVGPFGAAALRLLCGALILVAIVRPDVRDWPRQTWLSVVLLGLGLGGMNLFIYLAIDQIPLGIAVTIELMGPLAVAAAGSRRLLDGAWVLLAVVGILLLGTHSGDGAGVTLVGAGFAAVAATCWAVYILASSKLGVRVPGVDGLVTAMVVAAVVIAPVGAFQAVPAVVDDPSLLAAFAGVAILTSAIPYALEFMALKRMSTRVFGVLSSLGPAVAALAGLVVLGQSFDGLQLLAMALVVAASAGVVATAGR
ncbi:EamA family transporter [Gordonia phthalatica]|uniref:Transporter n=1 Tax=Gordonia phthalatica TaxID=1136941 RepID=A0A0N9ND77_9ACTN|nr:EamA family transporter [Gordonia phthalatica]ALG85014.1 transporter [Gordonia phthalatica]